MVQEYQSPVRVYKYPFEIVMAVSKNFALCNISLLVLQVCLEKYPLRSFSELYILTDILSSKILQS